MFRLNTHSYTRRFTVAFLAVVLTLFLFPHTSIAQRSPSAAKKPGNLKSRAPLKGQIPGTLVPYNLPVRWLDSPINLVNSVVFSPDGKLFAVGGNSEQFTGGGVQVYSVQTGNQIAGLPTRHDIVSCLAFSPDSRTLAVGGSQETDYQSLFVEFFDMTTSSETGAINTAAHGGVYAIAYSADGSKLAVGGTDGSGQIGIAEIWNTSNSTLAYELPTKTTQVNSLCFHGNSLLASGGDVWDPNTISSTGQVELWDASKGTSTGTLPTTCSSVASVAFSPDGKMLADGGNFSAPASAVYTGMIERWSMDTGLLIDNIQTNTSKVLSLTFNKGGTVLADAGELIDYSTYISHGVLEAWNVPTGSILQNLNTASSFDTSVAFSPDDSTLADTGTVVNADYTIFTPTFELWTSPSFQPLPAPNVSQFSGASQQFFTHDETSILTDVVFTDSANNSSQTVLQFWDASTGSYQGSTEIGSSNENVGVSAISPITDVVAITGSQGTGSSTTGVIRLLNYKDNSVLNLPTGANSVYLAAFSPDGQFVAATANYLDSQGNNYTLIQVWDTVQGGLYFSNQTSATNGVTSIALSKQGTILIVTGQDANLIPVVEVWNVLTGTLITTLPTTITNQISAAAYSPDESKLAIGGYSLDTSGNRVGVLELWNTQTMQLITTFPNANVYDAVYWLSFYPDGNSIITSGTQSFQVFSVLNQVSAGVYQTLTQTTWSALSPKGTYLAYSSGEKLLVSNTPPSADIPVTSISLSPTNVAGGGTVVATVILANTAPSGGFEVPLSSNSPNALVPSKVLVQANSAVASFTIQTTGVNTPTTAVITAGTGTGSQSASLTISTSNLISITTSPQTVNGLQNVTGTVTVDGPAAPEGTTIPLSSDNPAATTPGSVTIAGGQSTGTFTISTNPVGVVTTATIAASWNGKSVTSKFTILPPTLASVTINPTSVLGGLGANGSVSLTGAAGEPGIHVSLTSSDPSVTVPQSVVVQAGQNSASFSILTTAVNASKTISVTAKVGSTTKTAPLTLTPPELSSIVLNPNSVTGGAKSTATVTLDANAGKGGVVVKLSSNSKYATVPASVTVLFGKSSASVSVTTLSPPNLTTAVITANQSGVTQSANLLLTPPALVSVAVKPTSVVGGVSATGTLTITNAAGVGGMVVNLSSSLSSAICPSSVIVPAGKTTATFVIKTVPVVANCLATITGSIGEGSRTALLTIESPSLKSLTLSPNSVKGGKSSTGTVSITSPAPATGLAITITSSLSAVTVPATVTIPAGMTSVTFTVQTTTVKPRATATVSAVLGGTGKSATLTVL